MEQLYQLGKAAVTLNQDVEEVIGEVWEYMEGLAEALSQEQRLQAEENAVKRVEGEARAAVAGSRRTVYTRSLRNISSTGIWRFCQEGP
jgi:gamma-glutamylcyclotransferase (GGCT)/AIG2-like uncharacterized protein YtfP